MKNMSGVEKKDNTLIFKGEQDEPKIILSINNNKLEAKLESA
jgi:hypothetical protein